MKDTLFIKELVLFTTIGVYNWEQKIKQKLIIDIEMTWDHSKAASSDNVNDCLNYVDVSALIIKYLEGKYFALLERVAEEIANLLIENFKTSNVRLRVCKPGAVPQAKMVGICIERSIIP